MPKIQWYFIHDIKHNPEANKNVDILIYDVAKCFDKLEYTNTAIDLYGAGVSDDKFVTIANSNNSCDVAVKTPWGSMTKRTTLNKIEMQGTVLAGMKCSISIDTIGKEYIDNTHDISFKYKNCVTIPPLSFVDDIITINACSSDSIKTKAIIQSKLLGKQLKLSTSKCSQIHIGKSSENCPTLHINNTVMN